jgi:hypothetical protein
MRKLTVVVGLLLPALSAGAAEQRAATCLLIENGQTVWNGQCCVTASAEPETMTVSLQAESWRACQYQKRHPENETLPTYKQTCIGPWINISQESQPDEKGYDFTAYWSLDNACHGGQPHGARRSGDLYKGDDFSFEWRPLQ